MMNGIVGWLKKCKLHVLVWSIYIAYETMLSGFAFHAWGNPFSYTVNYIFTIAIFYGNALYVLPWSLKQNNVKYWLLPIAIALECTGFVFLIYFSNKILVCIDLFTPRLPLSLNSQYVLKLIFRAIFITGFSIAYYCLLVFIKEKKRSEILEEQRLKEIINRQRVKQELGHAQNAFLKAQINPHFLFNTLDFVYHNVSELSPTAADAIISLSEMMRFAIDADKMGEFIIIGDEIEQVQNLQYLNKLRKNEDMPLKLIYDEAVNNLCFIPLVLLTLAENVFKHGDVNSGKAATMKLYIENELFIICTDNISSRLKPSTSNRTGLINIQKRLKHAYGDSLYFYYNQDIDDHFHLMIKVPLKQLHTTVTHSATLNNIGAV